MAFESTEKFKLWTNKTLKTEEVLVSTKLPATLAGRVLVVNSRPMIKGFEQVGDEINISGRLAVNVVFKDINGVLDSSSTVVDFSHRLQAGGDGQYFVFARELQSTIEAISEKEISVSSSIELVLTKMEAEEISFLKAGNENCFEETRKIEVQTLQTIANEKFPVVEEFEIDADKVLSCDATVVQRVITSFADGFLVEGEIFSSLLVEKEGEVKNVFKNIQFTQEVAALGSKPNLVTNGKIFLNACTPTVVESENDKLLTTLSLSIGFVGFGYETKEVETLQDIFSDKNQLIVSRQGFGINAVKGFENTVSNQTLLLMTKEKTVSFGSIVGVTDLNMSRDFKIEKDGSGEGFVQCTVVYKHSETDELSSLVMGAPVTLQVDQASIADAQVVCNLKSFSKKKAKEIEIEIEVIQTKTVISEKFEYFVNAVEQGEKVEESQFAITVYAAEKGQTLFEIAKAMQVAPSIISSQNQNLPEVLPESRKIVLYRQNTARF